MKDKFMVCYRCNRDVTTKDNIYFEGGLPVHRVCPKKKMKTKKKKIVDRYVILA